MEHIDIIIYLPEVSLFAMIEDKYEVVKVIGQGQHGTVSLVRQISNTTHDKFEQSDQEAKLYAMKTIPVLNNFQDAQCSLLPHLTHPNIISIVDIYKSTPSSISIILEYASQGDLHNYCQSTYPSGLIPQEMILEWVTQIALGLFYLHNQRHVIHRDIKKRNVLVMRDGMIKLADFGVARKLEKNEDFAKTTVGTPYYISPEAINLGKYNNKSDVWALGCLIYELCARQRPFEGSSIGDLMNSIMRNQIGELPKQYSKWLRDLIKSMLQKNPEKRPTIYSILDREQIRKQFVILRQKFKVYENISYPQVNLRTTKYFERQEKAMMMKMKIFTQSLKTAKKDKCIRLQMQEGSKFGISSAQIKESKDIRQSNVSKESNVHDDHPDKKKKKVERIKFADKSLKYLIQKGQKQIAKQQ